MEIIIIGFILGVFGGVATWEQSLRKNQKFCEKCYKEGAEKKFKIINNFMYQEICVVDQKTIKGMIHFGKLEKNKEKKEMSGFVLFFIALIITFVASFVYIAFFT